jgi:predicted double-glycine peptidase
MLEISMFNVLFQYEEYCKKEEQEILKKGQEVSDKVFYIKQKISNSCGTMAIIHSIANNTDK